MEVLEVGAGKDRWAVARLVGLQSVHLSPSLLDSPFTLLVGIWQGMSQMMLIGSLLAAMS